MARVAAIHAGERLTPLTELRSEPSVASGQDLPGGDRMAWLPTGTLVEASVLLRLRGVQTERYRWWLVERMTSQPLARPM